MKVYHAFFLRLGRLARCATMADAAEFCDIPYDHDPPEYFFDRNGDNFASILGEWNGGPNPY